ncbi:MAG: hypothetical protein ABI036_16755 [Fibrobacteria bacterium]
MITKEKLQQYGKFKGDLDKWVSSQRDGADPVLNGADWNEIDKLIQRLKIEKHGFATQDYRTETQRVIRKTIEGGEAIEMIKKMDL